MAREQYVVVFHNGEWKVNFNDKYYGPYATQKLAISAAIGSAHAAGAKGLDAQVLVQGSDNRFRTEWTYGHDPYPRRG